MNLVESILPIEYRWSFEAPVAIRVTPLLRNRCPVTAIALSKLLMPCGMSLSELPVICELATGTVFL